MKIFKENMESIISTVDTENLPGYRRLLTEEYWKISDDQFDGVIKEVIEDIKEGKVNLIDTVKLLRISVTFSRKGLIEYDLKTLKIYSLQE